MNFISLQQDTAIIFYAIMGRYADNQELTYFTRQIEKALYDNVYLANQLIDSPSGHLRYNGLTTVQKVEYIYHNATGQSPSPTKLDLLVNQVNAGLSLGQLVSNLINDTRHYIGNDPTTTAQQKHMFETINATLYPTPATSATSAAADVQGIYYTIGSLFNADGVNYWSKAIADGRVSVNYVANNFVESRAWLLSLNNDEFVKRIYKCIYDLTPDTTTVAKYTSGLNNNSETRGDVIIRLMTDVRNDVDNSIAKQNFLKATHVYGSGEFTPLKMQENVAVLFQLLTTTTGLDARGLDSFSRMLDSGKSELALLTLLTQSTSHFSSASDFSSLYIKLYGQALTNEQKNVILQQAENNALQATLNIIEAYRNGKSPLNDGPLPLTKDIATLEQQIGEKLGYQENGKITLDRDGALIGDINSGSIHRLSHAEIGVLNSASLDVNYASAIDLRFAKSLKNLTLQGDYAANAIVINSLSGRSITLYLNKNNLLNADNIIELTELASSRLIADQLNIADSKINMSLSGNELTRLLWNGNSIAGGANAIDKEFLATFLAKSSSSQSSISANFISKNVYLTSNGGNGYDAEIISNINQFLYFGGIELGGYRGTGNIYLNGELISTEGKNIFDFGLLNQTVKVYGTYPQPIKILAQGELPKTPTDGGKATGSSGLILSGMADDVKVINTSWSSMLTINGDASASSKLTLEMAKHLVDEAFKINIGANNGGWINAGEINIISQDKTTQESLKLESSGNTINTISLGGSDNNISNITVTASTRLYLTIKEDFSDTLQSIELPENDPRHNAVIDLFLEKGGSGGGAFYSLLSSLNNISPYEHVISSLFGNLLDIETFNGGNFTVHGNTIIGNSTTGVRNVSFENSNIENLVTLNRYSYDQIHAGSADRKWNFGPNEKGNIEIYGNISQPNQINTLFNSLAINNTDRAFDVLAKAMSKITKGASENSLAEVGAVGMGDNIYVIIDKNHNQKFDENDTVFSIANENIYSLANTLHYQAPTIDLNGFAPDYFA
ncbi:hypothetical protein [Serratia marcescens]|uniref:hypothetical protein n=1 Tax=Serratia marcescens TaxID=615 RepID=UPI000A0F74D1|nr:hypothetical protein [Serratia marcescens]UJA56525.1 DUF4214 domain-containing protein [Serratia marcescens]